HKYMYCLDKTLFTGIHTGTLGFFVDYTLKELKECINDIAYKQPQIEKKKLLQVDLSCGKRYYAVNEMWLESYKTKALDIYLDGQLLEKYHGSGIVLSTQTGSTAFTRSVGGAVIQPGLEVIELSELSGIHHSHYRSLRNPLIVNGNTQIKIVSQDFSHTKLCFDRYDIDLPLQQEITCILADKYVQLAHYKPINWISHLKQLF
ncbi:MAG: NAD(+) kinase, partial [Erysipelotrichia bacterium]|nr:NAD(+) kinase [Erysipelotrichia bacterium]